ncbi:E3 ubiquitin-protein ligase UPL6 [Camellia lanceoleosa]|nr:E3 ubiquitin-protein ligase UPL6 [Camellia lanceoleosa]
MWCSGVVMWCYWSGDIMSLFAGVDYSSKYAAVNYRVKRLAYACIRAVHQDSFVPIKLVLYFIVRNQLKDQLFMTPDKSSTLTILLLEAVVMLIDPGLLVFCTFLLDALPPMQLSDKESKEVDEDEIIAGDEMMENGLNKDLELQISNAIDPRFLLQLTNVLFEGFHLSMVHMKKGLMTVLAYRTELVHVLWKFMKRCHENQMWSALSGQVSYLPGDAPGWLLPLSVFCPVYKHMLMRVDNEEFYEQEKPLSIKDIKCLVVILRQMEPIAIIVTFVLAHFCRPYGSFMVNPVTSLTPAECAADVFTLERHSLEFIQHRR